MKKAGRNSKKSTERHRRPPLAMMIAGAIIIAGFYLLAIFADFLSPYDYRAQSRREPFAPSSVLRLRDAQGKWHARPFMCPQVLVDPLQRRYEEDLQRAHPIEFFVTGYSYKLFGLFPSSRHLVGVRDAGSASAPAIHLLGTDGLGRDRFSRLLVGARFSLLTGPIGTLLASLLGILVGCLAGSAGRWSSFRFLNWMDGVLMRVADAVMALPALVMILAARAAFPLELPPARAATLLIGLFAVLGWAEMARLTRGLVMELQTREFVQAAVSLGMSPLRVLLRHILPNAARPLIAQTLLMLPAFFLSETALSFLGVGLQEPEASWGNLLTPAAEVLLLGQGQIVTVLTPALAIMLFVLGVRMLSAGLKENSE